VSDPGFRFTRDGKRPSPIDTFRRSISVVEQLPCDIIVSPHPTSTALDQKLAKRKEQKGSDPFVDTNGCRDYAAAARQRLEQRIAEER
jgi:metallo-beta-lactamase class B